MQARRPIHPLLLEPAYWRDRLQGLEGENQGLIFTPRPDLSGGGREVVEFRIRAHDGAELWGLFARPTWRAGDCPARIRSAGPAERPEIDNEAVLDGMAEFVFQEPAGRRLEDRVLDVVRVCQIAFQAQGIDRLQVRFSCAKETKEPDEFLIAEQLIASKYCL